MAANTPIPISSVSQAGIILYLQQCMTVQMTYMNLRARLEQMDRVYMREVDRTRKQIQAAALNAAGDPTKYQNIVVPICEPQVENAVTYQASVFLTGNPIFGVVADPANQDAALQMQTVIEENSIRGGWVDQFMMFFRDCFKYNLAAVEVSWEQQNTPAFETDLSYRGGLEAKPKNVIWAGNVIKRLDLYNTFFDCRVAPTDVSSKGEFAGYIERISRVELMRYMDSLPNVIPGSRQAALASPVGNSGIGFEYFEPLINPKPLVDSPNNLTGPNWMEWAGLLGAANQKKEPYSSFGYDKTVLYARIVPSEFKITAPAASQVQIWKFVIINSSVVIYAELQTNAHNRIPILFGQAKNDGLRYQTKSLLSNAEPFQSVATALMNSMIASRRRAISDRGLYDPSRVAEEHINSDNPAAKIPVRPRAYGKPLNEAYFPIPFRDEQAGIAMQEIKAVSDFSDSLNGTNRSKQGQFTKGNRTVREYEDVMMHSNGRDQMTAIGLEAQVFTPIKEIIKINIIQYQSAGEIYSNSLGQTVPIDPLTLRKTLLSFKMSDGVLPTDKIINGEDLAAGMQAIGTNPEIGAGYNLAPMFSYLMKTRNVDLKPFEKPAEQMAYEQAMQQWTSLAQIAIQKGAPFSTPMPVPAQFNYVPQGTKAGPAGKDMSSQTVPTTPSQP